MLKWLQQRVCFSFLHIFSILSGSCDRLASGTREWILILGMRYPILPDTNRPFYSMWTMNTVPNIDVCQTINSPAYQAAISSPPQWLQDPINHPFIHIICPGMIKNNWCLTMCLRRHPDKAIAQQADWPQPGTIPIRHPKHQRTVGHLIRKSMITTLIQCR